MWPTTSLYTKSLLLREDTVYEHEHLFTGLKKYSMHIENMAPNPNKDRVQHPIIQKKGRKNNLNMPLVCRCMKSSGNIKVMFLKTQIYLHSYTDSALKWQLWFKFPLKHCYSSISRRRGPYRRTYAICQSPPPDSFKMSSGVTTLTLSSSNFTHSSVQRGGGIKIS